MADSGALNSNDIPGFLIECLVWNAPNACFERETLVHDTRAVLAQVFNDTMSDNTCSEWGEVSELKYLFRTKQAWTIEQANHFLDAAWNYIGFK